MAKRKPETATNYPVPADMSEAAAMIAEIGGIERSITRLDADLKDELAKAKARAEEMAAPMKDRREALTQGLKVFCQARRGELTENGKRQHVRFTTGKCSWRVRPASVALRGVDTILANLKARGLSALIRVKEEVNKDAILADPDLVKGIRGIAIGSTGEDFAVEPFTPEGIEGAKS